MVSTVVFLAVYLAAGFVMCWQVQFSPWWAPVAPALAVFGLFTFVPKNIWLRMTGRKEQADLELVQAFMEQWKGGSF
jgi:CHASE2 domain-containing sensor protein